MTDIPEHLRKRAEAARKKAVASEAAVPTVVENVDQEVERIAALPAEEAMDAAVALFEQVRHRYEVASALRKIQAARLHRTEGVGYRRLAQRYPGLTESMAQKLIDQGTRLISGE